MNEETKPALIRAGVISAYNAFQRVFITDVPAPPLSLDNLYKLTEEQAQLLTEAYESVEEVVKEGRINDAGGTPSDTYTMTISTSNLNAQGIDDIISKAKKVLAIKIVPEDEPEDDYVVLGKAEDGFKCEVGHWEEEEQYALSDANKGNPFIASNYIRIYIQDGEVRAKQ